MWLGLTQLMLSRPPLQCWALWEVGWSMGCGRQAPPPNSYPYFCFSFTWTCCVSAFLCCDTASQPLAQRMRLPVLALLYLNSYGVRKPLSSASYPASGVLLQPQEMCQDIIFSRCCDKIPGKKDNLKEGFIYWQISIALIPLSFDTSSGQL